MLHQRDDGIAEPAKFSRLATVAASVVRDLLAPPPTVALRLGVAARAAVPETSVYEDGDVMVGQHEVGPARQPAGLGGVANLESSRDGTHPPLGRGSLGCNAPHAIRHFGRGLQRSQRLRHSSNHRCRWLMSPIDACWCLLTVIPVWGMILSQQRKLGGQGA